MSIVLRKYNSTSYHNQQLSWCKNLASTPDISHWCPLYPRSSGSTSPSKLVLFSLGAFGIGGILTSRSCFNIETLLMSCICQCLTLKALCFPFRWSSGKSWAQWSEKSSENKWNGRQGRIKVEPHQPHVIPSIVLVIKPPWVPYGQALLANTVIGQIWSCLLIPCIICPP